MHESPEQVSRNPHLVRDARSKIDKTVAYMEAQYGRAISREQLAAVAGLNPEHYSRIFRKYVGTSPMDYLANLRVEKAKELLQHTKHSVVEIGQMVGYMDPYHFSRRFKQLTGRSPAHFIREASPRVMALDGWGHCQALGIEPAAADFARAGGYVSRFASSYIENIREATHPRIDVARLRSLQPDLIMTASRDLEQQLSGVAPVIGIDVLQDPIYGQLPAVARALDRMQEAEAWIAQYENQCAQWRCKLSGIIGGGRVAVLRVREQLLQIYGMINMGYPLYRSLQLAPPERILMQAACNEHYHSSVITVDELPFYEAEHLFVVLQPDRGAYERWRSIIGTRSWREFPAVRKGNVHRLDVANWLSNDPISIMSQMQEAAALLAQGGAHHNYPSWAQ
jgi:AraC-like DNA-binding protein/ABC-type Fe3+-citrate transport system substrate-binding protein